MPARMALVGGLMPPQYNNVLLKLTNKFWQ
jgi:hypothetical protein